MKKQEDYDLDAELDAILNDENDHLPDGDNLTEGGQDETFVDPHNPDTFDFTDVFTREIMPRMKRIGEACRRIGIPFQACFDVKLTDDSIIRHHTLNNTLRVPETMAAFMIYHLPHNVSHMVSMLSAIDMPHYPIMEDGPKFKHTAQFQAELLRDVTEVATSAQLLGMAFQMGFVLSYSDQGTEIKTLISPGHVSCEMRAAYLLYAAGSPPKVETINLYRELHGNLDTPTTNETL